MICGNLVELHELNLPDALEFGPSDYSVALNAISAVPTGGQADHDFGKRLPMFVAKLDMRKSLLPFTRNRWHFGPN